MLVRISGSCSPRPYGDPRLGGSALARALDFHEWEPSKEHWFLPKIWVYWVEVGCEVTEELETLLSTILASIGWHKVWDLLTSDKPTLSFNDSIKPLSIFRRTMLLKVKLSRWHESEGEPNLLKFLHLYCCYVEFWSIKQGFFLNWIMRLQKYRE